MEENYNNNNSTLTPTAGSQPNDAEFNIEPIPIGSPTPESKVFLNQFLLPKDEYLLVAAIMVENYILNNNTDIRAEDIYEQLTNILNPVPCKTTIRNGAIDHLKFEEIIDSSTLGYRIISISKMYQSDEYHSILLQVAGFYPESYLDQCLKIIAADPSRSRLLFSQLDELNEDYFQSWKVVQCADLFKPDRRVMIIALFTETFWYNNKSLSKAEISNGLMTMGLEKSAAKARLKEDFNKLEEIGFITINDDKMYLSQNFIECAKNNKFRYHEPLVLRHFNKPPQEIYEYVIFEVVKKVINLYPDSALYQQHKYEINPLEMIDVFSIPRNPLPTSDDPFECQGSSFSTSRSSEAILTPYSSYPSVGSSSLPNILPSSLRPPQTSSLVNQPDPFLIPAPGIQFKKSTNISVPLNLEFINFFKKAPDTSSNLNKQQYNYSSQQINESLSFFSLQTPIQHRPKRTADISEWHILSYYRQFDGDILELCLAILIEHFFQPCVHGLLSIAIIANILETLGFNISFKDLQTGPIHELKQLNLVISAHGYKLNGNYCQVLQTGWNDKATYTRVEKVFDILEEYYPNIYEIKATIYLTSEQLKIISEQGIDPGFNNNKPGQF